MRVLRFREAQKLTHNLVDGGEQGDGQDLRPLVYLSHCHISHSQKVNWWGEELLGNGHSDVSGKDVSHKGQV